MWEVRGDIVAVLGGQLDAVDDEAAEGDLKLRELFEKEERLASRRWGR